MAINFIKNGIDTSDANATTTDILNTKTAYVDGKKITGSMPNNGTINITPSTQEQTIPSGYTSGGTVSGVDSSIDNNIQASNIKKDVTILGVTGTVEEGANINDYFVTNVSESVTGPTGSKSAVCLITKLPPLDLSGVTNMTRFFENFRGLEELPEMDTSDVTNMYGLCMSCKSLTTITHLDTSSATNMTYMFDYSGIVTLPQLNLQNVTSMLGIFSGCSSLSNESLNNILASLITATSYTSTKTLAHIGLSETQATTCTTLSNWAACEAAGWTTGY